MCHKQMNQGRINSQYLSKFSSIFCLASGLPVPYLSPALWVVCGAWQSLTACRAIIPGHVCSPGSEFKMVGYQSKLLISPGPATINQSQLSGFQELKGGSMPFSAGLCSFETHLVQGLRRQHLSFQILSRQPLWVSTFLEICKA